jgi:2-octaprenyl-6-methoxyphenol hydroxylase
VNLAAPHDTLAMKHSASPIIIGAGPVGALCALAMQHFGVTPRVMETRGQGRSDNDARTLVLSHGSRLILERLGVWARLDKVTPITRIHISQRGGFGTTQLSADEEHLPALGYVVSYGALETALEAQMTDTGIAVQYGTDAQCISGVVHTTHGQNYTAPLIVVADGGRGEQAPSPRLARDYEQMAIVCEVQTELPHAHRAYERFTPDGPVALLPHDAQPLPQNDAGSGRTAATQNTFALVWTTHPAEAERIAMLDDAAFLDALYQHFGGRQGKFISATPRKRFPLKLSFIGTQANAGVVRIGNAAQTLHPVSGQGLNIGLRDAWELAALCGDTSPETLGSAAMLRAYGESRRLDVLGGIGFTDFLIRAFSNDIAPIRHARGLGLLALEMLPPLKHFVARRMIFGSRG